MKDAVQSRGTQQKRGARCRFLIKNHLLRVGLAEFLSTYVMMVFGLGCVAQVIIGQGAFGEWISINLGFGLAVAMGMHVGGKVSGAHMNGAVSFTMCVFGQLPWKMLPLYIFAQLLGSFLGAFTIYGVYYEAIHDYSGGNLTVTGLKATAGIFATYPSPYLSIQGGFIDQVVGTAMLMLSLMALCDQKNKPVAEGTEPVVVGLLITLIGISLGINCGYTINPTRDIAPRVFTAIAGWGTEVFRAGNGWWWVPLVAPLIGGVTGAGLYRMLVELHHPEPSHKDMGLGDELQLEKSLVDKPTNMSADMIV